MDTTLTVIMENVQFPVVGEVETTTTTTMAERKGAHVKSLLVLNTKIVSAVLQVSFVIGGFIQKRGKDVGKVLQ